MPKAFFSGVAFTLAALGLAAFVAVKGGFIPANADAEPGPIETLIAGASLSATVDRAAPRTPNPVAVSDQTLNEGVRLFAENCAVCHGSARGDKAPSPIAKGLYPRPPQLASEGVEDDSEGESFWKIKHGVRLTGMPSFGNSLNDRQIWTLALFLKNMDKLPPAAQQTWQQVRNWPIAQN